MNNDDERRGREIARYTLIAGFLCAIANVLIEQLSFTVGNPVGIYLAYFGVPFLIIAIFVSVYVYPYSL